jgi:hypothetical protein
VTRPDRPEIDYLGGRSVDTGLGRRPPPGRQALLLTALCIGGLLLAMQLWLLTVALELYLGGEGGNIWALALLSGLVFAGGLYALRRISQRAQIRW